MPLNPETLEKDRQYIVKKCPYLIQEMITCVNQIIMYAYARQGKERWFFLAASLFFIAMNWRLFLSHCSS